MNMVSVKALNQLMLVNLKYRYKTMKHYQIIHNGLAYCIDVYASSKKDAIIKYRKQWNLVGKHINLQIWEV